MLYLAPKLETGADPGLREWSGGRGSVPGPLESEQRWRGRSVHPTLPGRRVHEDPVLAPDRPEHLVHTRCSTVERLPQNRFTGGADLPQGAVAAAVFGDGPRFEAGHGQLGEREIEDRARCGLEYPGAPGLGP